MTDNQLMEAVANTLNVPADTFRNYRTYTNPDTGDITLAATAKYGLRPFQERVVQEKKELDEKLTKLTAFLDSPAIGTLVDSDEQDRLIDQEEVMKQYSSILAERIANFKK